MEERCDEQVRSENEFKQCLSNLPWWHNQNIDINEIEFGYIEIGGTEVLKSPTNESIKVFIYSRWAVDEDGNLYLLSQLG